MVSYNTCIQNGFGVTGASVYNVVRPVVRVMDTISSISCGAILLIRLSVTLPPMDISGGFVEGAGMSPRTMFLQSLILSLQKKIF